MTHREDFLEYFNSNADGSDRTQDDAISMCSLASMVRADFGQSLAWKVECTLSRFAT